MIIAKLAAFDTAPKATLYADSLKDAGLHVVVTGPLDLVLVDRPGSDVDGWTETGKTWYLVVGSQQPITPV